MICHSCKQKYQSEGSAIAIKGYCPKCGCKLKFGHVLEGYLVGVALTGLLFFILIFSSTVSLLFLLISICGHSLSFGAVYWWVKSKGFGYYSSKREYEKNSSLKEFIGTLVGAASTFLWFFLAVEVVS